jgi:hypothetical protein
MITIVTLYFFNLSTNVQITYIKNVTAATTKKVFVIKLKSNSFIVLINSPFSPIYSMVHPL